MPAVELIMPKMGESIMEATILNWLKNEGDTIEIDDPVLEIATDKVDSEVPSPVAGILVKKLFNEGDVVPVGKAIAMINTEGKMEAPEQPSSPIEEIPQMEESPEIISKPIATPVETASMVSEAATSTIKTVRGNGNGRFYSPLVINIARREGIPMSVLETIPGSGKNDRVTKKDILAYIENPQSISQTATPVPTASIAEEAEAASTAISSETVKSYGENVEIIEMDRMRQLIARHMVDSKKTSAHVTSFVEADVTNIVMWRQKVKDAFQEKYNEKLTYTPIFIEAVVKAITDLPDVNVSVDGNKIILKKDINVGMATALPNGNLIVPVIRNADQLNLLGLVKRVNDLANRARNNKLKPHEIEGGTYTISNVGTFGNVMGTPIINQPQVAVMAIGAIRKKPVVIETPEGDTIGIRHMMFLSHSYDHRVVDGFLGGTFVRKVADYIEAFDMSRDI